MDIYKSVGSRVKNERKSAGLTIEELAHRAGISASFLSYVETGNKKCSLETVRKLAAALAVPTSTFFRDDDNTDALTKDAAARFKQMVRGFDRPETEAILDVVRSATKVVKKK